MIYEAFYGLIEGFTNFTILNAIMVVVGSVLIWLAIVKDFEPLLLIPIGFGCILTNMPVTGLMDEQGLLWYFYHGGVLTEIFPCLIFIGIGAMTDFGPLLSNPRILLLGAAAQFGIFLTLLLALILGFTVMESASIGIIGACDGPTAIYVTSKYAPHLLGSVSVAAYSYMSLVPLIQPPVMKFMTTKEERMIRMPYEEHPVSQTTKIIFPLAVTLVTSLIAPKGTPLMGMLMLGNFLRESGVVGRLHRAAENEIPNIVTLLLGISIGATMSGEAFLTGRTLLVFAMGFIAIVFDTAAGVGLGKVMSRMSGGKINPLIGGAGISAFPMSARVVHNLGRKEDPDNFLLMHAMGANCGGQIGSVMAAAAMLSILNALGITG